MIRILLHSDEPILAMGLSSILSSQPGLELIVATPGIENLSESLERVAPDVLLLDMTSDVTFSVLTEIKRGMLGCKVLLWVHSISTELAFQAMALGVRGILRKTLPGDLTVKCLVKVHEGELWFEKSLTDSFLSAKKVTLTQREGQLITLLAQGLKNKEIATMLEISEGTVKVYLSRLFQKVGVKDRFELALYGLKNLTAGNGQMDRSASAAHSGVTPSLRSLVLDRLPLSSGPVPAAPRMNIFRQPN